MTTIQHGIACPWGGRQGAARGPRPAAAPARPATPLSTVENVVDTT